MLHFARRTRNILCRFYLSSVYYRIARSTDGLLIQYTIQPGKLQHTSSAREEKIQLIIFALEGSAIVPTALETRSFFSFANDCLQPMVAHTSSSRREDTGREERGGAQTLGVVGVCLRSLDTIWRFNRKLIGTITLFVIISRGQVRCQETVSA